MRRGPRLPLRATYASKRAIRLACLPRGIGRGISNNALIRCSVSVRCRVSANELGHQAWALEDDPRTIGRHGGVDRGFLQPAAAPLGYQMLGQPGTTNCLLPHRLPIWS